MFSESFQKKKRNETHFVFKKIERREFLQTKGKEICLVFVPAVCDGQKKRRGLILSCDDGHNFSTKKSREKFARENREKEK